jgi:nucleotide-binding universal stress UspA family protein
MKLLLATDLSSNSPVVKAAVVRPWPVGTTACLLHVLDLPPFPTANGIEDVARDSAECAMKPMAEELKKAGLTVQIEVVTFGQPRVSITDYAKKWAADLILVGSHGASGVTRFLLGSTAQGVVRSAPCSVEVVRGAGLDGKAMKILLATDGSECATKAVRSVGQSSWPKGTGVRLISVAPQYVPIPTLSVPYLNSEMVARESVSFDLESKSRAKTALGDARILLNQLGVEQLEVAEVTSGEPKVLILAEAEDWKADLIVMGSHGWHGVDRLLMGSVSESVAMHAHCSVRVVR